MQTVSLEQVLHIAGQAEQILALFPYIPSGHVLVQVSAPGIMKDPATQVIH